MSMPGIGAINPNQGVSNSQGLSAAPSTDISSMVNQVKESMEEALVIDKEIMHVDKKQAGKTEKESNMQKLEQQIAVQKKTPTNDSTLATMASVIAEDQIDEKKKKEVSQESEFERKMAELSDLSELIDTQGLNDEEAAVVEKFKENMGRIQNLREQFKRLEFEEKSLEDILEEEEQKKKKREWLKKNKKDTK